VKEDCNRISVYCLRVPSAPIRLIYQGAMLSLRGRGLACAAAGAAGLLGYHRLATNDSQPASIPTLFSLHGRTALVTGGSQGLGKAIARGCALAGADVILSSRREAELQAALADVTAGTTVRGTYIIADLSKPGEAERLGQTAIRWARNSTVDIFVNNAGASNPGTIHKGDHVQESIPRMTQESWASTLEVNLTAGVKLLNELAPAMVKSGWGRVIHISSIGGLGSSEGRSAYSASKAGLIAITHAGALELGPHGVTVNCVAPGPFLTEMPLTKLPKEVIAAVGSKVPLRRWGDPEELVGPVLMLASEAASYVNGATLRVDGGLLARAY